MFLHEYIYISIYTYFLAESWRHAQNHRKAPIQFSTFQVEKKHQLRETLIWAKIAWHFSEDDYDHRRDERRHDDRYEDDRRREGGRL